MSRAIAQQRVAGTPGPEPGSTGMAHRASPARQSLHPWLSVLAIVAMFTLAGCSGGSQPRPVPSLTTRAATVLARPRPGEIPPTAHLILTDVTTGSPSAPASDHSHIFYGLRCANGLLTISTTREIVYAELPCDRSPPDTALHSFLATPVQIRVIAGNPAKLFLESQTAGTIEFTVGAIWIEKH